jgi:hypothetical protein
MTNDEWTGVPRGNSSFVFSGLKSAHGRNYFLSLASWLGSFNSAMTHTSKAGPKQIKTPIGIAQILMNLSIGWEKYSRFEDCAQLLIKGCIKVSRRLAQLLQS